MIVKKSYLFLHADFSSFYAKTVQTAESTGTPALLIPRGQRWWFSYSDTSLFLQRLCFFFPHTLSGYVKNSIWDFLTTGLQHFKSNFCSLVLLLMVYLPRLGQNCNNISSSVSLWQNIKTNEAYTEFLQDIKTTQNFLTNNFLIKELKILTNFSAKIIVTVAPFSFGS